MNKKDDSHSVENISMNVETCVKDSYGEPLVKPHDEPNVEASAPIYSKALTKITELGVDIPANDVLQKIMLLMSWEKIIISSWYPRIETKVMVKLGKMMTNH
ncbi:unnamed protein product [Vicia faba]|uniref:Uncharacterized protein n=1 Tax=Vicia faba TaxID=3906 RepID=A0AAV0YVL4_VICFA|nr:unnamed protein product [Vicia faba]